MIETLSRKLSLRIKDAYPASNVDVVAYELGRKLNLYLIIIMSVALGFVTGHLFNTILSMTIFAFARKLTGGIHFRLTLCTVFSVGLFSIIPLIHMTGFYVVILSILSTIIFTCFVRAERKLGLVLIVSIVNLFFLSPVVALTLLSQSILTINWRGGKDYE